MKWFEESPSGSRESRVPHSIIFEANTGELKGVRYDLSRLAEVTYLYSI